MTNAKKSTQYWLTVASKVLLFAIMVMVPAFVLGQSFQVTSGLVARTGPGESYPIARELPQSTRVTKVTEDPSGWVAIRLDDGQVVWIASDSFQTKLALLTTILPLGSPNGPESTADRSPEENPTPNRVVPATSEAADDGRVVAATAFTSSRGDGWRPAIAGPRNPDIRSREVWPERRISSGTDLASIPTLQPSELAADRFLDEVDQELSAMLTKHPALWDVKSLQDKLATLAGKPLTAAQIQRIDSLARKLVAAGRIADVWRASQPQNQIVPAGPGIARSTLWPQPGPVARSSGDPAQLNVVLPAAGLTALSTVVPPPSTRLPTEQADRNTGVAHNPAQIQAMPQPVPQPRVDLPMVAPASFDLPSSVQPDQLSQPVERNQTPGMSVEDREGRSSSMSLREEIARELNDLRRERFDAVGQLVKAQVRRPSDPPYMVVNESGGIVCYVRPAPGTLLRTYVGHWVGITGKKSRLADGRGTIITVDSLKLLDPPTNGPRS